MYIYDNIYVYIYIILFENKYVYTYICIYIETLLTSEQDLKNKPQKRPTRRHGGVCACVHTQNTHTHTHTHTHALRDCSIIRARSQAAKATYISMYRCIGLVCDFLMCRSLLRRAFNCQSEVSSRKSDLYINV